MHKTENDAKDSPQDPKMTWDELLLGLGLFSDDFMAAGRKQDSLQVREALQDTLDNPMETH